jgi:hypothetical protein
MPSAMAVSFVHNVPVRLLDAALLPTPTPRSWDSNIVGTLARCRENWLQPEALGQLANRRLLLARHEPEVIDAIVKFAKGTPREWHVLQ